MAFIEDIESIGFTYQSAGRQGVRHYALRGNRYLTYYCHVADDDSGAVFPSSPSVSSVHPRLRAGPTSC